MLKYLFLSLLFAPTIFAQDITTELEKKNPIRQQDKGTPNTLKIIGKDTLNVSDENGELQGQWERTHTDGFKMGYREKKWPNGNWRYQKNIKDGYRHGYCKFYYENGNIEKEGNYLMSKEDGLILTFYENGNLESEETYVNGVLHGLCKYFNENGTLTREGAFLENKRNGLWKFYSPKTSKLSSQITLVEYNNGQAISTKISAY